MTFSHQTRFSHLFPLEVSFRCLLSVIHLLEVMLEAQFPTGSWLEWKLAAGGSFSHHYQVSIWNENTPPEVHFLIIFKWILFISLLLHWKSRGRLCGCTFSLSMQTGGEKKKKICARRLFGNSKKQRPSQPDFVIKVHSFAMPLDSPWQQNLNSGQTAQWCSR